MDKKFTFFQRKIQPTLTAVMMDAMKVWWSIRLWVLQRYYVIKLGVPKEQFPQEVIGKLFFKDGIGQETVNILRMISAVTELGKVYGFEPNDTVLIGCYAAVIQERFEEVEMVAVIQEFYGLDPKEVRGHTYRKLIEYGDLKPGELALSDPERAAQVQRWLANTDLGTPLEES